LEGGFGLALRYMIFVTLWQIVQVIHFLSSKQLAQMHGTSAATVTSFVTMLRLPTAR
jgi:hypothetical protein